MDKIKKAEVYLPAVIACGAIMLYEGIRVTNILSLPLLFCIYALLNNTPRLDKKEDIWVARGVAAVLDAFLLLHGTQVLHRYELNTFEKLISLLVMLVGGFIIIERIVEIIYCLSTRITANKRKESYRPLGFIKVFMIILVCWLPFYLKFFPGNVTSDSTTQILQAIAHEYSNHHPVFQTWMIQGVLALTSLFTDSMNAAVATFIAFQCVFLALVYSYVVTTMFELNVKHSICVGILIYYAVMPYNIMMALNMWKDTLFSAGVLLVVLSSWRMLKLNTYSDMGLLFVGGLFTCMLRNNGLYSFLVFAPIAAVIFWKTKKCAVVVLVATIVMTYIIRGPIFAYYSVSEPNVVESIAIPMQQVACVVSQDVELSEEERKLISNVIDVSKIKETYDEHVVDPIKNLILERGNTEEIKEKKGEYFRLWLRLGMRNPGMYLKAFVDQTEGYYNPDIQRWQYTQGVWDTQMPIYSAPLLPNVICKALEWFVSDWLYYVPVLGMLKSMGFFVWLMFMLLGLCIIKKNYQALLLFAPLILYWGTIIVATPVYAEFRYVYCIFLVMPILIVEAYNNNNMVADEREKIDGPNKVERSIRQGL